MKVKYEKAKVLLCMGLAYTLYIVGIATFIPLHTMTDELGAIVSAATLAGRDWSGVINNSGYYGFGYYALFFWVFKLTDNPIIIYRVIIMITAFLRVLIIPIAYYIGKKYLQVQSRKMLYLASFAMSFLYSYSFSGIFNEYVLELLIWVVILLVCKVIQYHNMAIWKNVYSLMLLLVSFYCLLIHTRALALLLVLMFTMVVYGIIKKEYGILAWIMPGIPLAYFLSKKIIGYYQMHIYGKTGAQLTNATVEISSAFSLLDIDTWDVWIHMFIGLIDTEIILTGGIFLVCIIIFLFYVKVSLKNKFKETNIYCNIILSISILCMGGVMFAFLISYWFGGMLATWGEVNAERSYSYKGLTYVRYWDIFMPPFVLCCLLLVEKLPYKKILNVSAISLVALHICFIFIVLPLIQENGDAASVFNGLAYRTGIKVSKDFYYKTILCSIMVFLLFYVFEHSSYNKIGLSIVIIFLVSIQIRKAFTFDLDINKRMSEKIMASYEQKCKLEQTGVSIGQIYLNDTVNTVNYLKIYSIAQFYFNNYTLKQELPEQMNENDIIISVTRSDEIESKYPNVLCYVLDDNEVWYTCLELIDYQPVG